MSKLITINVADITNLPNDMTYVNKFFFRHSTETVSFCSIAFIHMKYNILPVWNRSYNLLV